MTDPMTPEMTHVAAFEAGAIRVYALQMPAEQVRFLSEPGALEQVLGVAELDRAQVDIFQVRDLEEVGIAGYLVDGCGVPEEQVAEAAPRLNALDGAVMIVRSRAFGGKPADLTLHAGVVPVAFFTEPPAAGAEPMPDFESARPGGAPAREAPRTRRKTSREAGIALLILSLGLLIALVTLATHFL
ncbi:hypothetical protein [Chachezhania sediminis]|uniref:hypothetical protein n=1 Tax=Chachezhania sediminis TaxID=2599291 RepID=UPI00131D1CF4|nr:hypothetical protein [Chachezhania sediminis]